VVYVRDIFLIPFGFLEFLVRIVFSIPVVIILSFFSMMAEKEGPDIEVYITPYLWKKLT
jgi:hypothetical protein